jgi:tRNA dimethylallyltransferase
VGCTASGKSALAIGLARRLPDVEVVSADSMQVYRGMDIGTAKPTPAERAELPHHLLDLVEPDHDFSLAEFQLAARAALSAIEDRGHRALLVGGTGLYVQAIVDRLAPPGRYPMVVLELQTEADTAALHRRLTGLDPLAASRILPGNRRRVLRALEVTVGSGRPFSSFGPGLGSYPKTSFRLAGVWLPRAAVSQRIAVRFGAMVSHGLVEEVRGLRQAHPAGLSRTAGQALGYREILEHLEAGRPLADCLAEAVRRTRGFARRQRVWWRRDPRITWFGSADNPLDVLPALLEHWKEP